MRIELAGGSVKRLVDVWRDFEPLPGEKSPKRIVVDQYGRQRVKTVAGHPHVNAGRWQRFLVDEGPEGDELLAALQQGPIKPAMRGGAWWVDLDRIKRPAPRTKG